jgi:hypothetical protein
MRFFDLFSKEIQIWPKTEFFAEKRYFMRFFDLFSKKIQKLKKTVFSQKLCLHPYSITLLLYLFSFEA